MSESDRSFYIGAYSDEVMPCLPDLESWAAWLAKPDANWGRPEPAKDGDRFRASVIRWAPDIIATFDGEEWSFSREAEPEAAVIAVRFGPGMGWSCEDIVDMAGLREFLSEQGGDAGQVEHVAVGLSAPDVMLTYYADPPRLYAGAVN